MTKKIILEVPTEFSGRAAEALAEIKSSKFRAEIKRLTKGGKLNVVDAAKRLRAKTWGKKSAVEILEELERRYDYFNKGEAKDIKMNKS